MIYDMDMLGQKTIKTGEFREKTSSNDVVLIYQKVNCKYFIQLFTKEPTHCSLNFDCFH